MGEERGVGAAANVSACAQACVSLPICIPTCCVAQPTWSQAWPGSSSGADLAGSDLGQVDEALAKLFADVYSLVDAHELARALSGRTQALRECAWGFIRARGDRTRCQ